MLAHSNLEAGQNLPPGNRGLQFFSSDMSSQLRRPSHSVLLLIQWPLAHWNWPFSHLWYSGNSSSQMSIQRKKRWWNTLIENHLNPSINSLLKLENDIRTYFCNRLGSHLNCPHNHCRDHSATCLEYTSDCHSETRTQSSFYTSWLQEIRVLTVY